MTEKEKGTYITKHLFKFKLLVESSIHCPEPKCTHIVYTYNIDSLNRDLSKHISKMHRQSKNNYSKKLIAKHIKDHRKQTPDPAQEQLKNTKKRKTNT